MSSPPDPDQNTTNTAPTEGAPDPRPSSPPSIIFTFPIQGPLRDSPAAPRSPTPHTAENGQSETQGPAGEGNGTDSRVPREGGEEGPTMIWTFTLHPEPYNGTPSVGMAPPAAGDAASAQPAEPAASGAEHTPRPNGQLPPPWLFPPFFNFFMPVRSEPQPDPEKAAELIRSLPTVGTRLLMRVDKVVAAQETDSPPEEKGWKCGICLEGVDDEGEQEVKALPCNHLFHGKCLEPWFATKHTCPSCRLDLDPLQTLNVPPSPRQNPLRPSATGSNRPRSPHPYARDRPGAPAEGENAASEAPHRHLHPDLPGRGHGGPSITFFWSAPPGGGNIPGLDPRRSGPAAASGSQNQSDTDTRSQAPTSTETTAQPSVDNAETRQETGLTAPSTPGPILDAPTFASPLPMGRRSTPPPEAAATPAQSEERGSSETAPSTGETGASAQTNVRPPVPAPLASGDGRPQPQRRPHITIIRTDSPGPGGLGLGGLPFPFLPPHLMTRPSPAGQPNAQASGQVADLPARESTPFVPQSLESWTEEREKLLGWRCDAPECVFAPYQGDDADADVNMPDVESEDEAGKEMLSIYSTLQPEHEDSTNSDSVTRVEQAEQALGDPHPEGKFVLLACPHRYHRSCIELAERSSGRPMRTEKGKVWVRCDRCRKDGWVRRREVEDAPSEREVENIIA